MHRGAAFFLLLVLSPVGLAAEHDPVSPEAAECANCGVVRAIREVRSERALPGVGTAADPRGSLAYRTIPEGSFLVGPTISGSWGPKGQTSSQLGARGSDRMLEAMQQSRWEVIIRLDSGSYLRLDEDDASDLEVGDRVKIEGGRIELLP
jgi:hypothetical protein